MALRMQRWDEAFRVLHVELDRGKAVLLEYMQDGGEPGAGKHGGAAADAGTLL